MTSAQATSHSVQGSTPMRRVLCLRCRIVAHGSTARSPTRCRRWSWRHRRGCRCASFSGLPCLLDVVCDTLAGRIADGQRPSRSVWAWADNAGGFEGAGTSGRWLGRRAHRDTAAQRHRPSRCGCAVNSSQGIHEVLRSAEIFDPNLHDLDRVHLAGSQGRIPRYGQCPVLGWWWRRQ